MAQTETETLAARAARVIPGGVMSANRRAACLQDATVVRSKGARFWTDDGREFLDFHCAGGPIILGHRFDELEAAVQERAADIDLVGVARTAAEVELAEELVLRVPSAERVLLTTSGSEATYHAIRLARAVTARRDILKFEGCYHGWHDAVAVGFTLDPTRLSQVGTTMSRGSLPSTVDATIVVPYNDADAVANAIAHSPNGVAAVIVEPIAHNVGTIHPVPTFLPRLREICDRTGTILIFDEVITGFRHSLAGVQESFGVTPDLTVLGKAMANGYPIAALVGRAALMEEFTTSPTGDVLFAGTFNGDARSVIAAIETIRLLEARHAHEHLFALGTYARDLLTQAFEGLGCPTVVAGHGSIFVTYFLDGDITDARDLARNNEALFVSHREELVRLGVFKFPANLKRAHVSYSHTASDIEKMAERSREAIRTILSMGQNEH